MLSFSTTYDVFGLSQGSKGSVYKRIPYSNYPVGMCRCVPEIEAKMLLKCQNNEFRRLWQQEMYSCRSRDREESYIKCFHMQIKLHAYLKPFRWYTPNSVHPSSNHIPHYSINTSPNRTSRGLKWSDSRVDLVGIRTRTIDSKFEWKCENAPSHSWEKRQRDRAQPQKPSFVYFQSYKSHFVCARTCIR